MNNRLALHPVEYDAEVQFALDGQCLFHQKTVHDASLRAGLMGDQRHAQHFVGDSGGFLGVVGDVDSAALAAAAPRESAPSPPRCRRSLSRLPELRRRNWPPRRAAQVH